MALLLYSAACAFTIFVFLQGEVLFVSCAHLVSRPKKKKNKPQKEYEKGNKSAHNLEKMLLLQQIRCVAILVLFHWFPVVSPCCFS